MTKDQRSILTEPKFRPEEVAEILGVDRKAVMRLTNAGLMGYYTMGLRARRIGEQHLIKYLTDTRAKALKISRQQRARLEKLVASKDI